MQTLDFDILLDRIGIGPYQYKNFIIVSLVVFVDGFQIFIEKNFILSFQELMEFYPNIQYILMINYFVGQGVGNLLLIQYTTHRKILLIISLFFQAFFMLILSEMQNFRYYSFYLLLLFGLPKGIIFPLSIITISEVIPSNSRGKYQMLLQSWQLIGFLFIQAFYQLYDDWREIVLLNTFVLFFVIIISIIYLEQNPRYLFIQDQYTQAFVIIDKMISQNQINIQFFEQEIIQYNWIVRNFNEKYDVSIKGLFNVKRVQYTHLLMGITFSYGIISVLLPLMVNQQPLMWHMYQFIILMIYSFVVDNSKFQINKTCSVLYLILGFILLYYSVTASSYLDFILYLIQFIIGSLLNIIINQLYCSIFRIIGMGFLLIITNIGKILICLCIVTINKGELYLIVPIIAILALFNSYLSMFLFTDKTQKQFDRSEKIQNQNQQNLTSQIEIELQEQLK